MSGSGATVYGLFEKAPLLKDDYKEHFYFESQLG
jgi:4-diphosphocytidyl-2C-methyl-D-erythritol kinase